MFKTKRHDVYMHKTHKALKIINYTTVFVNVFWEHFVIFGECGTYIEYVIVLFRNKLEISGITKKIKKTSIYKMHNKQISYLYYLLPPLISDTNEYNIWE